MVISGHILNRLFVCLFVCLFDIVVTSKVISGQVPTCDRAH